MSGARQSDAKSGLLTTERRREILRLLNARGKVRSAELSERFVVSEDTVRRDLRDLADAGLLQRVHGGALPTTPTHLDFSERREESPEAKEAIARAAAALIRPGQVVIIDAGTTPLEVATQLPYELRATVITNSPPVAIALAQHAHLEIHLVGGRLYGAGLAAVGAAAVAAFQAIHADVCILGVAGLHPEAGIGVLDLEEAHVKAAMIAGSADVVAVAAADKLGAAAPYSVGPVTLLTHIVTERRAAEAALAAYRRLGITVITA
jgi:DeoR/GlpR family transcriptional regulator of sugar metabolism